MPEPTPTGPTEPTFADWARQAARAADDKLGRDTVVIEVGDVLAIPACFVISGGGTVRQVRAIADEVEEQLTLLDGPKPVRVEGRDDYRWVLMDFGGFVVHLLAEEARAVYDLERLWSDCPRLKWQPV